MGSALRLLAAPLIEGTDVDSIGLRFLVLGLRPNVDVNNVGWEHDSQDGRDPNTNFSIWMRLPIWEAWFGICSSRAEARREQMQCSQTPSKTILASVASTGVMRSSFAFSAITSRAQLLRLALKSIRHPCRYLAQRYPLSSSLDMKYVTSGLTT